jgi:8-oxo-dGTP diphosphatase
MEKSPTLMLVSACALFCDHCGWLMQKRPAGTQHAGLWEFPGGKLESGETPVMAAIREAGEELGIAIAPQDCEPIAFAETLDGSGSPAIVILLYKVANWEGQPAPVDGAELGWFSQEEVLNLPKPPLDVALAEALFKKEAR